jgi:PKD repeat protein
MPRIFRYVLPIYDLTIIGCPLLGYAPHHVTFAAIIRGGVPPYSYHWDFGDGTPPSTEPMPTHTYESPGLFTVTLTVTDSLGLSAQTTIKVTVTMAVAQWFLTMAQLTYTPWAELAVGNKWLEPSLSPLTYTPWAEVAVGNVWTELSLASIAYSVLTDVRNSLSLSTDITYTISASVS